jgi:hypothetical protein
MKTSSLTLSVSALLFASSVFAADVNPGPSAAGAAKTRAQVVAELQQAIANGEIRRGPLADIYESTANVQSAPTSMHAESRAKSVPDQTKNQPDSSKRNLN